jgi:crotonobetainyl-CoA:carnitine CoA-transferase CaiB-like acyl-CoA transferase
MGPLTGIRILDLTSVLMGPYATSILGDMGADVIKLENLDGDIIRKVGPSRSGEMGGMFFHANRSKRSLAVNLKTQAGLDIALRLAKTVDVLVYNVRPQAMSRLGLTYETLSGLNPRLIYVGTFGFGQDGPYAARPAYDDLIQGASGVAALLGRSNDGAPQYVPVNIADRIVGLHAVNAILAALRYCDQTGKGQRIDIPMFETMTSFVLGDHLGGLSFQPPLDQGGYPRLLSRDRRPFQTADGYLCVVVYTDAHWQRFLSIAGAAINNPARYATHANRMRHIDEINSELATIFRSKSTAAWIEELSAADIPFARLHDLDSIQSDPHLKAVGFFTSVKHPSEGPMVTMAVPSRWSESQPESQRLAPRLGEHSTVILREIGFDDQMITQLEADAVIRSTTAAPSISDTTTLGSNPDIAS